MNTNNLTETTFNTTAKDTHYILKGIKMNNKNIFMEFPIDEFPSFKFLYEALLLVSNKLYAYEFKNNSWHLTDPSSVTDESYKLSKIDNLGHEVIFRTFSKEQFNEFEFYAKKLHIHIKNLYAFIYDGSNWNSFRFNKAI